SAAVDHVDAKVLDKTWLPTQLTFVRPDGSVLADLHFDQTKLDQGLDPADLRAIPPDAEVIDER
ncbi:MAG TPA: hypothetical protein VF171_01445, partial [Trueperaceae bacterium]